MSTTNASTVAETILGCICGNCPTHRMARGLQPFCRMSPPPPRERAGFDSYAEAEAAAKPGQRVRSIGGGLKYGCAPCFVLVDGFGSSAVVS